MGRSKNRDGVLGQKGVRFSKSTEKRWGIRTTMLLPDGGVIGLYEPKHPVTFGEHGATQKPKVGDMRRQTCGHLQAS